MKLWTAALALLALSLSAGAQTMNTLTPQEQKEGWKLLFDGRTLNGWTPRGDAKWEVRNGEIAAVPGEALGFLTTTDEYADFQLRLEFFLDANGNSGAFLRVPASGAIAQGNSYEVNMFDKSPAWPTGSINEIAKTPHTPNTIDKWNTYDITARGDHFVVLLNGEKTVDTRVPADALAKRQARGPIALQYGNPKGVVRFRNIRVLAK